MRGRRGRRGDDLPPLLPRNATLHLPRGRPLALWWRQWPSPHPLATVAAVGITSIGIAAVGMAPLRMAAVGIAAVGVAAVGVAAVCVGVVVVAAVGVVTVGVASVGFAVGAEACAAPGRLQHRAFLKRLGLTRPRLLGLPGHLGGGPRAAVMHTKRASVLAARQRIPLCPLCRSGCHPWTHLVGRRGLRGGSMRQLRTFR
mmetsp:Transcript_75954/g.217521  ORF Transcript_75954/g.217521 Transcript_75954/m.217521 type:complete len:200 (+) Transcript_75954:2041-2640(+)